MSHVATLTTRPSAVLAIPAAPALQAMTHFAAKLAFETDCSDVFSALTAGADDFILLDVRTEAAFLQQHAKGAQNLPHRQIRAERMALFPANKTFVVYCAGPHCNGADQAAYKIAALGYPVKLMIGGITGWAEENMPPPVAEVPPQLAALRHLSDVDLEAFDADDAGMAALAHLPGLRQLSLQTDRLVLGEQSFGATRARIQKDADTWQIRLSGLQRQK